MEANFVASTDLQSAKHNQKQIVRNVFDEIRQYLLMKYIESHHGMHHRRWQPNGTIHQHLCLCTALARTIHLFLWMILLIVVLLVYFWLEYYT